MAFYTSLPPTFAQEVILTIGLVPANEASVQTFTNIAVSRLLPVMLAVVNPPANFPTGLIVPQARIPSNGVLELVLWNLTNADIPAASYAFKVFVP